MTDMIPRAEADARVAAALEAVVDLLISDLDDIKAESGENSFEYRSCMDDIKHIRAITPDDARAALDQMISDAVNEATKLTVPIAALDKMMEEAETRGMLRAAEIAQKRARIVEHPDDELKMTHRAHALVDPSRIAAAIRAEAE